MYLKKWEVVVSKQNDSRRWGRTDFYVKAVFQCPSCKFENAYLTLPGAMEESADLDRWLEGQFIQLKASKKCADCGVVSGLPNQTEVDLKIELHDFVTPSWVRAQDRKLHQSRLSPAGTG